MNPGICSPHLKRKGVKIAAYRTVFGEPMCASCFYGKPIDPKLEGETVHREREREKVAKGRAEVIETLR